MPDRPRAARGSDNIRACDSLATIEPATDPERASRNSEDRAKRNARCRGGHRLDLTGDTVSKRY
jgi:hypothetical protein